MDRAAELRALMKAKSGGGALTGKDKAKYLKSLREGQKEKEKVESRPVASHLPPSQITSVESSKAALKQVRVVSIPALAAAPKVAFKVPVAPTATTTSSSSSVGGLGLVGYGDDDDEDEEEGNVPSNSTSAPPAGFFDEEPSLPSSSSVPAGFFDEEISSLPVKKQQGHPIEQKEYQYTTQYDFDKAHYEQSVQAPQPRANAAEEYAEQLLAEASADSVIPRGFFDDPLADLKARGVDIKKIEKKQEKREEEELKR